MSRQERNILAIPTKLPTDVLAISDKIEVFGNFAKALRANNAFEDNYNAYRLKLPVEINGVLYVRKPVWR